MKFRYTDNGDNPPATTVFMGRYAFELGGTCDITDEAHIAKAQGNASFVEMKARAKKGSLLTLEGADIGNSRTD